MIAGLPPALAGVGSAVNDTTRNMGSVLGVAVFGSITASVFASRMGSSAGYLSAAAAAAAERPEPDSMRKTPAMPGS